VAISVRVLDLDKDGRHGLARKLACLEAKRYDDVDPILIVGAQYHCTARDKRPEILGIDQSVLFDPNDVVEPHRIILERISEYPVLSRTPRRRQRRLKLDVWFLRKQGLHKVADGNPSPPVPWKLSGHRRITCLHNNQRRHEFTTPSTVDAMQVRMVRQVAHRIHPTAAHNLRRRLS
jgi:hypothetical protein